MKPTEETLKAYADEADELPVDGSDPASEIIEAILEATVADLEETNGMVLTDWHSEAAEEEQTAAEKQAELREKMGGQ